MSKVWTLTLTMLVLLALATSARGEVLEARLRVDGMC
jgi:hypothetical protein